MSKQRPSPGFAAARWGQARPTTRGLWYDRVFKNSFTRNGQRFRVKRWSVKIQFQGQRRAFSLSASGREAAALEAEGIYHTIVRSGWEAATRFHKLQRLVRDQPMARTGTPHHITNDAGYWKRRLIRRRYLELVRPSARTEFS